LPDAVLVYADSHVLFANRAVEERLGWEPARMVGRSVTELLAVERIESGIATFLSFERSVAPGSVREETIVRRDGTRITCDVAGLAFEFEGRRAALAILRDVTDRRRMEAQLRQADRLAAVGSLAAGVAHEINNPLTYLAANVAAVRAQLGSIPADPAIEGMRCLLDEAAQGAERIRRIVSDLRTFARPEDSAVRRVRLRAVLDLAIAMTSNEIRHRARLLTDLGPLPRVRGSEARLAQVLVNLLLNAAQAIPAGQADRQRIRVSSRTGPAGEAIVEVADTGAGIPAEIRDRVFDPFFTTKPFGEGTGLGLAASHGIVQSMGGRIEIDEAPEGGALVRVTLPGAPGAPDTVPPTVDAAEPRGRVLVVDDVTVAVGGEEALEVCANETFDVVLCDVMMPGLSGVDVLERLRAADPAWAGRFVFVTGGAFSQVTADALERTGVPRVDKPVDPVRLAALVRDRVRARKEG
jgi:PAS domain S-box-containing protein